MHPKPLHPSQQQKRLAPVTSRLSPRSVDSGGSPGAGHTEGGQARPRRPQPWLQQPLPAATGAKTQLTQVQGPRRQVGTDGAYPTGVLRERKVVAGQTVDMQSNVRCCRY